MLRALGATGDGTVLVAVDEGDDRRILGTVMLQLWPHGGRGVVGPGEAEIRALAVAPAGRAGARARALLTAVIERAAQRGVRHLAAADPAGDAGRAAHVPAGGFRRLPERDW